MSESEKTDNVIFVGKQPAMVYATSVMLQAKDGHTTIFLRARGRSISRAVDVSQLALRRFVEDYKLGEIKVGTEEREYVDERTKEKKMVKVSTIEIELRKEK